MDDIDEIAAQVEQIYTDRAVLEGRPAAVTTRLPGYVVLSYLNGDDAITARVFSFRRLRQWAERALAYRRQEPEADQASALWETAEEGL